MARLSYMVPRNAALAISTLVLFLKSCFIAIPVILKQESPAFAASSGHVSATACLPQVQSLGASLTHKRAGRGQLQVQAAEAKNTSSALLFQATCNLLVAGAADLLQH